MADPKGFLSTPRETPVRRPVDLRLLDWREVYEPFPPSRLAASAQSSRQTRSFHSGIRLPSGQP